LETTVSLKEECTTCFFDEVGLAPRARIKNLVQVCTYIRATERSTKRLITNETEICLTDARMFNKMPGELYLDNKSEFCHQAALDIVAN